MELDYKLSKSEVYKFFPQPIFSYEIDNYKEINKELIEFIFNEYNKDNDGVKRSNINGWHSKSFKFEKNNAAYKFAIHIEKYIFDVFKQYGWPFKAEKVKINEMWSIINKKNSYNENSVIAEIFTKNHGKVPGIIFGATSKKIKNYLQIGNNLHVNFNSKSENRIGYFKIEIQQAISPYFFEDKKKLSCISSAINLIKLLIKNLIFF